MTEPYPCPCPAPCPCGEVATKWSGHDMWTTLPHKNVGVQFRCPTCDPYDKWFDYCGEALYQDKDGLWRIGTP